MMLVGIIWAVFAPLILLASICLIAWALRRVGKWPAIALASVVTLVPVATLWLADHAEFATACEQAHAVVRATAKAEGFLLASETANSFGTRYIYHEGFSWFEARDIYNRDKWVRYERTADVKVVTRPVTAPEARYEVRETFTQPLTHTSLDIVSVIDRSTGAEMSRAGSAQFSGGRATWVLGAWGTSTCPSALSDSEGFRAFYHLARDTLR